MAPPIRRLESLPLEARKAACELNILCIGGSLRLGSTTYLALQHCVELLVGVGARPRILDLREMTLPFCNGDKDDPHPAFPDVARLRNAVTEADALILATPEYHGGLSGVLKNALDLLDFPHLEGKVIGCVSVLGGRGDSNALNDMRRIARWCHAWVVPEQVAIGRARENFATGRLQDPELCARMEALIRGLVIASLQLRNLRPAAGQLELQHS